MGVARQLPILGNAQATEVRYLFHFSSERGITDFEARPINYCWADVLSADVGIVHIITNAPRPEAYSALYVLRIGLPDEGSDGFAPELTDSPLIGEWVQGKPGVCMEYALAAPFSVGSFAKIDIYLDPTRSFYHP